MLARDHLLTKAVFLSNSPGGFLQSKKVAGYNQGDDQIIDDQGNVWVALIWQIDSPQFLVTSCIQTEKAVPHLVVESPPVKEAALRSPLARFPILATIPPKVVHRELYTKMVTAQLDIPDATGTTPTNTRHHLLPFRQTFRDLWDSGCSQRLEATGQSPSVCTAQKLWYNRPSLYQPRSLSVLRVC